MPRSASLAPILRDDRGSVTVEALIMFPVLVWILLATVVFFKAFHAESLNVKVTYTIGDILSREDQPITPGYMDSMFALQRAMTGSPEPQVLRVTAITYLGDDDDDGEEGYRVIWSQTRGGGTPHTDASLAEIAGSQLPVMSEGQVTILTETWLDHTPAFMDWVGLDALTFHEIIPTRPRAPQFCWNTSNDSASWTEANTVCNL